MPTKKPRPPLQRRIIKVNPRIITTAMLMLCIFAYPLIERSANTRPALAEGELRIHVIDVGQGASVLVEGLGVNILLDAGEPPEGGTVVRYLHGLGINKLDYIVASHPHSDHIGGIADVLRAVQVGSIIAPRLPDELIPTTRTYLELLELMVDKGLGFTAAQPGAHYELGAGATLTVLAPVGEYDDLNNYSVVCRIDCGNTSFLFTGDIESKAEGDLLAAGVLAPVDILYVPHHGSNTSSGAEFLAILRPDAAVVSVGASNTYGHPNPNTVERLERYSLIFRTDIHGSVVISTDGADYTITPQNGREFSFAGGAAA